MGSKATIGILESGDLLCIFAGALAVGTDGGVQGFSSGPCFGTELAIERAGRTKLGEHVLVCLPVGLDGGGASLDVGLEPCHRLVEDFDARVEFGAFRFEGGVPVTADALDFCSLRLQASKVSGGPLIEGFPGRAVGFLDVLGVGAEARFDRLQHRVVDRADLEVLLAGGFDPERAGGDRRREPPTPCTSSAPWEEAAAGAGATR